MKDELSEKDRAFLNWMALTIRQGAVDSLLKGNDTQCFTVEQYQKAYDTVFPCVEGVVNRWRPGVAEMHLHSLSTVEEKEPGVWGPKT